MSKLKIDPYALYLDTVVMLVNQSLDETTNFGFDPLSSFRGEDL